MRAEARRDAALLLAAALLFMMTACAGHVGKTAADDDPGEMVALPLPVSAGGTGTVVAPFTGTGSEGMAGKPPTRYWISLDSSETVRGEFPHAELTYDASTRFLVNGRPLGSVRHSPPLAPDDISGWPARVEYRRMPGGSRFAMVVDVQVPADWVDTAAKRK